MDNIEYINHKYRVVSNRHRIWSYIGTYFTRESAEKALKHYERTGEKMPTERLNGGIHLIEGAYSVVYKNGVLGRFPTIEEARDLYEERVAQAAEARLSYKNTKVPKDQADVFIKTVSDMTALIKDRIKGVNKAKFNRAAFLKSVIDDLTELRSFPVDKGKVTE